MDIVNVVATGSFNQPVDFSKLTAVGDKLSYPKGKYPGVYIHLSACSVTIYKNGKYIFTGVPKIESVNALWYELSSLLTDILDTSLFTPPQITNVVACDDLKININLALLFSKMSDEEIEYEPEIFPGFVWKTKYGTANLFSTGKVMLLGCKTNEELNNLLNYVSNTILKYTS